MQADAVSSEPPGKPDTEPLAKIHEPYSSTMKIKSGQSAALSLEGDKFTLFHPSWTHIRILWSSKTQNSHLLPQFQRNWSEGQALAHRGGWEGPTVTPPAGEACREGFEKAKDNRNHRSSHWPRGPSLPSALSRGLSHPRRARVDGLKV